MKLSHFKAFLLHEHLQDEVSFCFVVQTFVIKLTLMIFMNGTCTYTFFHFTFLRKLFVTKVTHKRLFSFMTGIKLHVQITPLRKLLVTNFTFICLVSFLNQSHIWTFLENSKFAIITFKSRAARSYEDTRTGPNQVLRPIKVQRTGPNQVLRPKKDMKTGWTRFWKNNPLEKKQF